MAQRDDIVAAAMEPFARLGFARTSMSDIAQAAGLTRTALYHYFPNKEAVFQAINAAISEGIEAEVNRAVEAAGKDRAARIEGAVLARYAWAFELLHRSAHGRELIDEKHRRLGPESAEGARRFHAFLSRNLARGDEKGTFRLAKAGLSAERAAALLMAALDGVMATVRTEEEAREGLRSLTRVFLKGLSK